MKKRVWIGMWFACASWVAACDEGDLDLPRGTKRLRSPSGLVVRFVGPPMSDTSDEDEKISPTERQS